MGSLGLIGSFSLRVRSPCGSAGSDPGRSAVVSPGLLPPNNLCAPQTSPPMVTPAPMAYSAACFLTCFNAVLVLDSVFSSVCVCTFGFVAFGGGAALIIGFAKDMVAKEVDNIFDKL